MTLQALAILGRGAVEVTTPVALADDAGLTRGDGCFEGLRVRRQVEGQATIDELAAHLDRLERSARALEIDCPREAWEELAHAVVAAWVQGFREATEAAVKLVLTRGRAGSTPTGYAIVSSLPPDTHRVRRDGVDVITLDRGMDATAFADAPWLLGGIKTLSYAVNMAAQREAARRGADDAVLVSRDGWLLEATTSSVVWVRVPTGPDAGHAALCTVPPGANGILASVTLRLLMRRAADAGLATSWTQGRLADLRSADAAFLVSSVRGPVLIRSLDGVALPASDVGRQIVKTCQDLTGFA